MLGVTAPEKPQASVTKADVPFERIREIAKTMLSAGKGEDDRGGRRQGRIREPRPLSPVPRGDGLGDGGVAGDLESGPEAFAGSGIPLRVWSI